MSDHLMITFLDECRRRRVRVTLDQVENSITLYAVGLNPITVRRDKWDDVLGEAYRFLLNGLKPPVDAS